MAHSKIQKATPKLLEAIRAGMTYEKACKAAGITYRTLCYWRERAQAERDRIAEEMEKRERKKAGKDVGPLGSTAVAAKERKYVEFLAQIEEAEAEAELLLADVIRAAAVGGSSIKKTLKEEWIDDAGNVVKSRTRTITEEQPSDWRAAGWMLDRRGWKPIDTINIEMIMPHLTDDELRRIESGENPTEIIAARLASSRKE